MIEVKNLTVSLGDFMLKDATLSIERGEYFIILGPTGAGKTVLLESIAGLYPIEKGEIWLDGRDITHIEPEKRNISVVYQDYVLFPHLTVKDNITYGLRLKRKPKKEINDTLERLVSLLNIRHLLDRKPDTLSGGESQKVSLARALSVNPLVLLLDEPLSALDPGTKEDIQRELRNLHEQLNLTIIHVTHDFEEAVALGDRIAVVGEGKIMQVGTAEQVFRKPNSEFVARFAMSRNIFKGEVTEGDDECAVMNINGRSISVVTAARGMMHASIRPEDILVSNEPILSSARNCMEGTIEHIDDRGPTLLLTISGPPDFICMVTRRSFHEMDMTEGKKVYLTFKATAVHVF
jgi:molybdopterin-binding protein